MFCLVCIFFAVFPFSFYKQFIKEVCYNKRKTVERTEMIQMNRNLKNIYIHIGIGSGLFALSAMLLAAARKMEEFSNWYAEGPYKILTAALGRLYGVLPFSAAEVLLYIFVCSLMVWIIYVLISAVGTCLKVRRLKKESIYFAKQGAIVFCLAGCLLFSYK